MADTFVCALQIAYGHILKARVYKNSELHRDKIAENTNTHTHTDKLTLVPCVSHFSLWPVKLGDQLLMEMLTVLFKCQMLFSLFGLLMSNSSLRFALTMSMKGFLFSFNPVF